MPRTWLIAAVGVLTAPWLVVLFVYTRTPAAPSSSAPPSVATPLTAPSELSGKFGRLTLQRVVISPPLELVPADWEQEASSARWYFPGVPANEVGEFLTMAGIPADRVGPLIAGARTDGTSGSLVLSPDQDLLRSLSPDVRARLYLQLAHSNLNFQSDPFRFFGTPAAWFDSPAISPQSRQLLTPLVYSDGMYQYFADLSVIKAQVPDVEERRKIGKALVRSNTMLVRLNVDRSEDAESLAAYWGVGGRRMDLRPLLESVAGGQDRAIDIAHLLPPVVREHLYRFPRLSAADYDRPALANCLWSALNFFATAPDDRYLNVQFATNALKKDYYVIETDLQLGDVIAFLDERGVLFHVAVHLAGNLVFTKNGTSPLTPWIISTLDEVKGFYRLRSASPQLMVHRRNGF